MIQIYCGNGKGKTTAALGQALRAAGQGMKIHIVQFMKGSESGEVDAMRLIPNITLRRCGKDYGFIKNMSDSEKLGMIACHNAMLKEAEEMLPHLDMLVLDEFNLAYRYGLFDISLAERIVLKNQKSTEIILTGRDPSEIFLDAAAYISEINALKHPFASGVGARRGIEY